MAFAPAPPGPRSQDTTTTPSTQKLRNSCVGCASSKVKCPKEKPACSRCIERGLACEYTTSKRLGRHPYVARRVASESESHGINDQYQPPSGVCSGLSGTTQTSDERLSTAGNDVFCSDAFQVIDPQTRASRDPTCQSIDELFTSVLNTPALETSVLESGQSSSLPSTDSLGDLSRWDTDSSWETGLQHTSFDSDMLWNFANLTPGDAMDVEEGTKAASGLADASISNQRDGASNPMVTPGQASVGENLGQTRQTVEKRPFNFSPAESTIANNKHTIDCMINMLASENMINDEQVKALALLACKIISWYAAVVRNDSASKAIASHMSRFNMSPNNQGASLAGQVQRLSSEVNTNISSSAEDGSVNARVILDEIHRMQKLVHLLTRHLDASRRRSDAASLLDLARATAGEAVSATPTDGSSTLSVQILDNLESDLQSRLREMRPKSGRGTASDSAIARQHIGGEQVFR